MHSQKPRQLAFAAELGRAQIMLGWIVYLSKLQDGGTSPATDTSEPGQSLAVWKASAFGLGWLDDLVKSNKAIKLDGNGYPNLYTGTAEILLPFIESEPSDARKKWIVDKEGIVDGSQPGDTIMRRDAIESCRPEEWLLLEAWDES